MNAVGVPHSLSTGNNYSGTSAFNSSVDRFRYIEKQKLESGSSFMVGPGSYENQRASIVTKKRVDRGVPRIMKLTV